MSNDDEYGDPHLEPSAPGKSSMHNCFKVGSAAILCAALALLLLQPGKAQAHPQLIGTWNSVAPSNYNMSYTFDPGQYIGAGIWRGTFTLYWANNPVSCGFYEIRIGYGTSGAISLRDGVAPPGGVLVGEIDIGTRVMNLKGVIYRP
jgi:hypothetical protein